MKKEDLVEKELGTLNVGDEILVKAVVYLATTGNDNFGSVGINILPGSGCSVFRSAEHKCYLLSPKPILLKDLKAGDKFRPAHGNEKELRQRIEHSCDNSDYSHYCLFVPIISGLIQYGHYNWLEPTIEVIIEK